MSGVTVRVDRFGQTRLVMGDLIFRTDEVPRPPDAEGVYTVTSIPTEKEHDR